MKLKTHLAIPVYSYTRVSLIYDCVSVLYFISKDHVRLVSSWTEIKKNIQP